MSKSKIMPSVVLGAICLIVALLLALVNMLTEDRILENANAAVNQAYEDVLPDGVSISGDVALTDALPKTIEAIKSTSDGGYAVKVRVKGYKPDLVVICGVSGDGKITGTKYTDSSETNGAEAKLVDKYQDATLDTLEAVIIAGSTKTSEAYHDAVKASLQAYTILTGGSVDMRDPAEILQGNCNEALGTTGVLFEKWFATEVLTGADAIYVAKDESGYAVKIGETFVGVNKDGAAVNADTDADAKAAAEGAVALMKSSVLEEVAKPEGAKSGVVKVYKTKSGNYVFELQAAGYGILGGNEPGAYISNEYIKIKLAISADGVIIGALTTYQKESKNFGDACKEPEYYEQFEGLKDSDVVITEKPVAGKDDPGVIGGATYTTNGYQKAIKQAFEAFELLTGGDE